MRRAGNDIDDLHFPYIAGQGSIGDLRDDDPRNQRLAYLKSVSYAGAVGLGVGMAKRGPIGFHVPRVK